MWCVLDKCLRSYWAFQCPHSESLWHCSQSAVLATELEWLSLTWSALGMYSWLQNLVQRGFAHLRAAQGRHQSRGQFRIEKHLPVLAGGCSEPFDTGCAHLAQPPLAGKADAPKHCWKPQWQGLEQNVWPCRVHQEPQLNWSYTHNNLCAFGCTTPSITQKKGYMCITPSITLKKVICG